MCARLLTCPLCAQPGFLTLDALRTGLISVATRPLTCPVCNEVLLGIDKLTIHLFSHSFNLNNIDAMEPSKCINIISNNPAVVHSIQSTVLEDLNVSKVQITDPNRILENDINTQSSSLVSFQSLQNNQHLVSGNKKIEINHGNHCYTDENIKHTNYPCNYVETEDANVQTFKNYMPSQLCDQLGHTSNKVERFEDSRKPFNNEKNHNDHIIIMNKMANITTTSISNDTLVEKIHENNIQNDSCGTYNGSESESFKPEEILSQLKFVKTSPTKERPELCNICSFHFPNHDILLLHKQLVHMINEKDPNTTSENFLRNYSCHLCSKVFKMKGSLMVHMRVAHMGYNLGSLAKGGQIELIFNETRYSCSTCGKKFKKEQHLVQHLKTHEAKQWECDICSKMFTTKYFLKKHKRLHSGEMPYKCNICNKTFTFQQSYHKHRLYHKDDKPHTCATCGRSFKELSTLHNHERIHTGEKPFVCETCGKCFRQRVSYLVHRRIHTGVMPYKCITCGKSFRYKVSQRTHKCLAQQTGNMQQTSMIKQPSCLVHDCSISDDLDKTQKEFSSEDHIMTNIMNHNEDKFLLTVNSQDHHFITKESNIQKFQNDLSKKQKSEESAELNNKDQETTIAWKSDIPNGIIFKKSFESTKISYPKSDKTFLDNTNDIFSMVISPFENGLSSPTAEMEHLRVSSPAGGENILKTYETFKNRAPDLEINIVNTNLERIFTSADNSTGNLETINEESLKQLLYNINEK